MSDMKRCPWDDFFDVQLAINPKTRRYAVKVTIKGDGILDPSTAKGMAAMLEFVSNMANGGAKEIAKILNDAKNSATASI